MSRSVPAPYWLTAQGRYLPVFASAVLDGNKALKASDKKPINLQSVMIGNGITDFCAYPFRCTLPQLTIYSHYDRVVLPIRESECLIYHFYNKLTCQQCQVQKGRDEPVQPIGECVRMAEAVSVPDHDALVKTDMTGPKMPRTHQERLLGVERLHCVQHGYQLLRGDHWRFICISRCQPVSPLQCANQSTRC